MDLEYELGFCERFKPRELKNDNSLIYQKVTDYAESLGFLAGDVLRVFETHRSLNFTSNCLQCDKVFNVYEKRGKTCSKSCQSLYMHLTRGDDVKARYSEKLRISNNARRESGDLSETSRRAFKTRRKNHTPEQISDQYRRVGESHTLTVKKRKENERKILIERIRAILVRKSPLIILRLYYASGFIKIYENLLTTFIKLGFDEFKQYFDKKKYRYAIKNGLQYIVKCVECGNICSYNNEFCSYDCVSKSESVKNTIVEGLKKFYSIPGNKEALSQILSLRNLRRTPEERHLSVKKIYSNKTQDWIDAKSDRAVETRIERGQILPRDKKIRTEYDDYRNAVRRLTNTNKFHIPGIENRGKHTMHIDHIYPIVQGFLNKIPPELISDIKNLQMLDAIENKKKNGKIITIPEHIQEYLNAKDNKRTL